MALILLAVYALLIGWTALTGAHRSTEAFYVNNRASSAFGVAFSIVVSCVGASATIGMIGMAFKIGTPAFWWLGSGSVGLVFLSLFLAKKIRKSGSYTLPQMAGIYLGKETRPLIAFIVVVAWSAILAAQFTALGTVLEALTGFGPRLCLGIGFLLICGHTLGGQSAIMRVDKRQTLIILAVLATMLFWLCSQNPGWTAGVRIEAVSSDFPVHTLLYFLVVVGANYLVCPMLFGRIFSARNEKTALIGALLGAAGIALCALFITATGLAARGLIPMETTQDAVLTTVLAEVMPGWLHIAVALALVSAIVSSADSCLVTAATVCANDLCNTRSPAVARLWVVALGVVGATVSLADKGILGFLLMAYDMFACGVVMPCFIGLLLHPSRRIDVRFACVAIIFGGVLGVIAALTEESVFNYLGMGVSACVAVCGVRTAGESNAENVAIQRSEGHQSV